MSVTAPFDLSRRWHPSTSLVTTTFLGTLLFACAPAAGTSSTGDKSGEDGEPSCVGRCDRALEEMEFDYIVVGSGAGGGPVASRLAQRGQRVLLLEAGDDAGDDVKYQIPAFHVQSTEHEPMQWDYYVDHFGNDATQAARDTKMACRSENGGEVLCTDGHAITSDPQGILYPRAGTLGGCTAHNAMITVRPHDSDWNGMAETLGDDSFLAGNMQQYFQRLERNQYLDEDDDWTGHGRDGWLTTELTPPSLGLFDRKIRRTIEAAAVVTGIELGTADEGTITGRLLSALTGDLNGVYADRDFKETLHNIPLATNGNRRVSTRELILDTAAATNPLITVRTGALVSRVLFDDENTRGEGGERRAIGVEFLDAPHLYQADPNAADPSQALVRRVTATREVILSAGAFNTPQLLMLSGIGEQDHLAETGVLAELGLDAPRSSLPGVGRNLQDRYEVGVVSEFTGEVSGNPNSIGLIEDCTFTGDQDDPCKEQWDRGEGPYISNGGVLAMLHRSQTLEDENERMGIANLSVEPDLFIFGLIGDFRGYYPEYAARAYAKNNMFTWAILKGHTRNQAGTVRLRSTNPWERPEIDFAYFGDDTSDDNHDLNAVVDGVELVLDIIDKTDLLVTVHDLSAVWPPERIHKDRDSLRNWVRDEAWGHHACGTAKMGADDDPMAVLDSRFRVRGIEGLRVVDASIFPEIPGYFIVTPIYMISEKAADVILEDAELQAAVP